MKLVLTIILFIILMCSSKYMFEDFTTSSSGNQTTQSGSAGNQTTQSGSGEYQTNQSGSVINYFELNNEASNLVEAHKNEVILRELQYEEDNMKNNVRRIVNHAKNVLSYVDLNRDYLEKNL